MKTLLAPLALLLGLPLLALAPALVRATPWDDTEVAKKKEPITLLELSRQAKNVKVYQDGKLIASYPVAVGRPDSPTPLGEHTVHRMMKDPVWSSPWSARKVKPSPLGPIGTRWIGFWYTCGQRTSLDPNPPQFRPGTCNEIGFHGTGRLKSIGKAASSGCVRMFDRDAVALYDLVKEGTRVRVID
jgi:L,D-transpeptidase ErfK/SrfK